MLVVADTSPLNYLLLIGEIEVLPKLYGKIYLPTAVFDELQHRKTSIIVREWTAYLPAWVEVRNVTPTTLELSLMGLGQGERDAIFLAIEMGAKTILMDDSEGRVEAQSRHLQVRGTLGILELAARQGHLNFREALSKLEKTTFRFTPKLREFFLQRNP